MLVENGGSTVSGFDVRGNTTALPGLDSMLGQMAALPGMWVRWYDGCCGYCSKR